MTRYEKLRDRFLSDPKDFTWQELVKFLGSLGYVLTNAGKSSGSRVRFIHSEYPSITLHKPHPKPTLKRYQIEHILSFLKQEKIV
jgi:hypothetical protein